MFKIGNINTIIKLQFWHFDWRTSNLMMHNVVKQETWKLYLYHLLNIIITINIIVIGNAIYYKLSGVW